MGMRSGPRVSRQVGAAGSVAFAVCLARVPCLWQTGYGFCGRFLPCEGTLFTRAYVVSDADI